MNNTLPLGQPGDGCELAHVDIVVVQQDHHGRGVAELHHHGLHMRVRRILKVPGQLCPPIADVGLNDLAHIGRDTLQHARRMRFRAGCVHDRLCPHRYKPLLKTGTWAMRLIAALNVARP